MDGKLFIVSTPIGNLGDMSARAVSTLEEVDYIAAEDTRRTLELLSKFRIRKPLISYYQHNIRERGETLLDLIKDGRSVALVSDAGTPAISDPGEDLVRICAGAGITVVPVPGSVAAIAALTVSGLPTGRFTFVGFLPVNKRARREELEELSLITHTLIFYEAPHKLMRTLNDFLTYFGDRDVSISREITKIYEETLRLKVSGAIAHFGEIPPRGEFTIVVSGAEVKPGCRSVLAEYEYQLGSGLSEKEAMRAAAKVLGVSKRDVYKEVKVDFGGEMNL